METQEQPQYINPDISSETNSTAVNGVATLEAAVKDNVPKLPPAQSTTTQLQQISDKIAVFLARLPDYIGNLFNEYKSPITTLALIFAAIISVKLVFAVLDAINDIPLFGTIFELVGIGYATWFISRYLLKASTRQELVSKINNFQNQIFG
jgi:CAAD domains of cyanobacterial aminoacyl-tRNA synthetase